VIVVGADNRQLSRVTLFADRSPFQYYVDMVGPLCIDRATRRSATPDWLNFKANRECGNPGGMRRAGTYRVSGFKASVSEPD
jgi:hypothetical protein